MTDNRINILIFLRGVVSVSLQIVILFKIMNYTKLSILIMCIVLLLFLIARSSGNMAGRLYTGDKLLKFKKNMVVASILVGMGLSSSITDLFFVYIKEINVDVGASIIVLLYSSFIMCPIIYILSQTTPLMTKFKNEQDNKESTILTSKIGNILGGLSLSVLLMNNLGMSWAIIINASILLLVYLYTCFSFKKLVMTVILFLMILTVNDFGKEHKNSSTSNDKYSIINTDLDEKVKALILNYGKKLYIEIN